MWCCSLIYAVCWLLQECGPVLENFQYSIIGKSCAGVGLNVAFSDVTRVAISFNIWSTFCHSIDRTFLLRLCPWIEESVLWTVYSTSLVQVLGLRREAFPSTTSGKVPKNITCSIAASPEDAVPVILVWRWLSKVSDTPAGLFLLVFLQTSHVGSLCLALCFLWLFMSSLPTSHNKSAIEGFWVLIFTPGFQGVITAFPLLQSVYHASGNVPPSCSLFLGSSNSTGTAVCHVLAQCYEIPPPVYGLGIWDHLLGGHQLSLSADIWPADEECGSDWASSGQ